MMAGVSMGSLQGLASGEAKPDLRLAAESRVAAVRQERGPQADSACSAIGLERLAAATRLVAQGHLSPARRGKDGAA